MDAVGNLEVRWAQGLTDHRVEFVDKTTVCYTSGNCIVFLDLDTKKQSVFQCPGRGIGTFTANGKSRILAFSERKLNPSIFVYSYPKLVLENELKGSAQLDYTSLALSDGGPYLGCCSTLPDHSITVWNWENAEPICSQPRAGKGVVSLVFNPMNWLQICALGTISLTVWNIEKSASFHVMKPSVIELPAADGSVTEREAPPSHIINDRLTYFGPQMPATAISGLTGDKADIVVQSTRATLTATAICWTATSELYVGCKEGFLLLVDPDSLSVSVLFNPTAASAIPELKKGSFQSLALHGSSLIAAKKEGAMHCLHIKESQIEITQTWEVDVPVTSVMYSPDYETLLSFSNMGQICICKPAQSEKMVKVLDILSGNFVAGALLHTKENICVSVRDSGELQLWSADGFCIGSLRLQAEVTSLACCPVAHYAAVGTVSGHVLFIDLIREQQPRLVHKAHLYSRPVDHLVFDQDGNYLLTGASDAHVFVVDAKPSKRFSIIGYTVVPGPILSLSAQYIRDRKHVKVLALCSGQKDQNHEGSLLTLLTLPVKDLAGCVDLRGCLSNHTLQQSIHQVPHALQSCVLGVNEVFAYCHKKKALQRFQLPQNTDRLSGEEGVQLKLQQEVEGHPLGPASLALSPHHSWLVTVGRDGLLRVRETSSLERCIEIQCHSCHLGGVRSVSFSADSQALLTTGLRDGSLVCTDLKISVMGAEKGNEATQYRQIVARLLVNVLNAENLVLSDLPDWSQTCLSSSGSKEPQEEEVRGETETVDVTEQDGSHTNTAPDPTWLESKQEAVVKAEIQQYYDTKKNLEEKVKELRNTIQEMMRENENLPDAERLEQQQFNLNVEEQRRSEMKGEQEVTKVRNETELDNLAKSYLYDVLKRECWDSMVVKGKAVRAFYSDHKVKNYPMRERTEKELEELLRVQNMRKIEKAASIEIPEKRSNTASEKEEEEEEEGDEADSAAVTGSLSAQLGCSNPYLYDQFNLQTTEQKINQIILLQDVIYQVKTAFNREFEAMHKKKQQEVSRVKDKNKRIREIMVELGVTEELWEPSLADSEQPERALIVKDSEIKVEKYLSPEQKKEEEERKKLEEQRRLAAKGDEHREKALDDMMGGALEVKKEDILNMEIPQPEFVLSKPDTQWSEEEKKVYKEYEKKNKELSEEQEKYRKSLEIEMRKLQASIKDATEGFDETLTKLLEWKVKSEMVIYQEELKITNIVYSILIEEEIRNREVELSLKLEKFLAYKAEIEEELQKHKDDVESFLVTYDNTVAEDKLLDKKFRKDFLDVPVHIVEHLYKLFKRRPRVQKMRTQMDSSINIKDQSLCGWMAADGLSQMLKAMEELDAPENMPEDLDPLIWERFCLVRRAKVESEQQVKTMALTLAEMQAFLQKRIDENETYEQEIKNLTDELDRVHKEKNCFRKDIMVQVLMKQGQVELTPTDLTADYSDSVLHHRSVVEGLNHTIKMFGEQKIAAMVDCKEFLKGLIQEECEHNKMEMQIEDLNTNARDIEMFHVSRKLQEYLSDTDYHCQISKQVSTLQKAIALQEEAHLQSVQHHKKTIELLNRQAAIKAQKDAMLDQQLANMQVTVAERGHICDAIAVQDNQEEETEQRYQEIIHIKNLEDLAKELAVELDIQWTEVERLRMKTFPSLRLLTHN
ncbi:cilia- and flagella-associated protein 43 [Myripristis murdjan]|uniref:cilia- and flagella-associated protein 43 n=1 Tax=Myripristis murdjan TaxID=586833 RepID=UPI001176057A|nr:cilia- and flagella-associated protein 43 [Myripristis murdjan]